MPLEVLSASTCFDAYMLEVHNDEVEEVEIEESVNEGFEVGTDYHPR